MSRRRTLWEEGRAPARLVAATAAMTMLLVAVAHLTVPAGPGLWFDLGFVLICVAAGLAVHPRDFYWIGVLPPLLMGVTVTALALLSRESVADPGDGLGQALVSGLAHHTGALVTGYLLTLGVLGLRRVALSHSGRLRSPSKTRSRRTGTPLPY